MDNGTMKFTAEGNGRRITIEVPEDSSVEDLQEVWESLLMGLTYQHGSVREGIINRADFLRVPRNN
jgi:hypothetical protein